MNEFKLYAEEYYTAKRIANILYRPAIDKAVLPVAVGPTINIILLIFRPILSN